MKSIWMITTLTSLLAVSTSTLALNFGFMDNGPAGYFTSNDFNIMENKAVDVLNKTKDGTKATWKNPKTTAWGYFIPYKTTTQNGITCRQLKIFQSAKSMTNLAEYKFCKINNDWRITN